MPPALAEEFLVRRGWNHAREHGDLSEDRGGAGDEVAGKADISTC